MTKRFHIVLLIVALGFFLMPQFSMACEMKSKHTCCDKEMSTSKGEKMDCCKKSNHSKSKEKEHDGPCNGKCGHSNCTTSTVHYSVVFFEINYNSIQFKFSEEKQNYIHTEDQISSGFTSLWLIPKIS
jgi:hypothetical protein